MSVGSVNLNEELVPSDRLPVVVIENTLFSPAQKLKLKFSLEFPKTAVVNVYVPAGSLVITASVAA